MSHIPAERLSLYVMGALPPEACRRIESHLADCPQCQQALQAELALEVDLQAWGEQAPPLQAPRIRRPWRWAAAAAVLVAVGAGVWSSAPTPWVEPTNPDAGLQVSLDEPGAGLHAGKTLRDTPCLADCTLP